MAQHFLVGLPLFLAILVAGTAVGTRALDRWTDRIEERRAAAAAAAARAKAGPP